MASANDSTPPPGLQSAAPQGSSTAVQTIPLAEPSSVPLPPQPKSAPITAKQLAFWTRPLDDALAVSVLILTFLLASFAARNSDQLMHFASGRGLLDGTYKLGEDPFAFTTEGVQWVNHSWLYGVGSYVLFKTVGGPGLVVVKALLVTLLAGFMLAVRRPGQSLWIPAVCGLIAAAALSQRLLLQPAILSYLFLGVTLYLLQKPAARSEGPAKRRAALPGTRRQLWLLPMVFLCWVNMDPWFLLGPIVVALYWAGEQLQDSLAPVSEGADRRGADDNRTLGLVLAAGIAACVINPYHINAFTLPAQLSESGAAGILQSDYHFAAMFWGAIDFYKSGAGWSVAGVAYLVLLGLGVLSFAANYQDWRGWRILVWMAFAGLSVYHARATAFFAVVGGPIAALNFQDAIARHFGVAPRLTTNWKQWAIAGRAVTLAGAIVLIALAWPGWLHATLARGETVARNVAWRVEFEPSLEKATKQLQQWRNDGVLGKNDRGLNFAPDIAHACAWFAPDEKGFIDGRIALFEKAAADYVAANKALTVDPESSQDVASHLEPLAQILRQNSANHLIFHYAELLRFQEVLVMFENDRTKQWTLVYRDGRTAIFSWDDPQKKGPPSRLTQARISDDLLAFGPPTAPPLTERAAAPEAWSWYERYLHPRQARPLAADEAGMHLQYFDATLPRHLRSGLEEWLNAEVAGLVGSAGLAPLAGEPLFRAVLTENCVQYVTRPNLFGNRLRGTGLAGLPDLARGLVDLKYRSGLGPIAPPLLAVRAARRALLENPNDAATWYRLQRAYAVLSQGTREREWAARLPLLQSVRQVQRMAALNHALLLDPEYEPAHLELASMYQQMRLSGQGGYLDLELKHRSEQLRLVNENGPMRRERPEDFERRRKQLEDLVDQLDAAVKKAQNDYEVGQVGKPTMRAKAEFALEKGLGGQARDELLHSLEVTVEPEAIPLQLNLMVMTGAIEGEAGIRVGLDKAKEDSETSGQKPNLGRFGQDQHTVPVYEWLQVMVAAASGDYRAADENLEPMITLREQVHRESLRNRSRSTAMHLTRASLLDTQITPMTLWRGYERAYQIESLKIAASNTPHTADIYALRGLLALEAGDNAHAAAMFKRVTELRDAGVMPVAKYYLDSMEANR